MAQPQLPMVHVFAGICGSGEVLLHLLDRRFHTTDPIGWMVIRVVSSRHKHESVAVAHADWLGEQGLHRRSGLMLLIFVFTSAARSSRTGQDFLRGGRGHRIGHVRRGSSMTCSGSRPWRKKSPRHRVSFAPSRVSVVAPHVMSNRAGNPRWRVLALRQNVWNASSRQKIMCRSQRRPRADPVLAERAKFRQAQHLLSSPGQDEIRKNTPRHHAAPTTGCAVDPDVVGWGWRTSSEAVTGV